MKDPLRRQYIRTLPKTLKQNDISLEFTTKEGAEKAYLIKKYFDPAIQKDIWDMLVIYEGEIQTKYVQKGRQDSAQRLVRSAEGEASQPSHP